MNSKLIELIKSFSPKEIREFKKYAASPYFNNEKSVRLFVSAAIKTYPGMSESSFDRKKVFAEIYPGKKYNDAVFRNIASKTLKLAEGFLVLRQLQRDPGSRLLFKLRALAEKKQFNLFQKSVKSGLTYLCGIPVRDSSYYYTRMMFESELRKFHWTNDSNIFISEDTTQNVVDNCINFFTAELMSSYAVMLNAGKFLQDSKFDFRFLKTLLKYYEDNPAYYKGMHFVHLYYNSIKLFQTDEEKYFDNVYEIILKHYCEFPEVDKKNAYVVLINYCSEKINKGEVRFMRKRLELYKEVIDKKAQYEGLDYLSHVFYYRVVYTAVHLNETEWALGFMEQYKPELPKKHRENTYCLALAEYYLRLGKFDEAVKVLSKVKKLDFLYKLHIYSILLKTYYSAGQTESFYSEASSFKEYLHNNRAVSKRYKKLDSNFINLTQKLYKIKISGAEVKSKIIDDLREEIIRNEYTSEKYWLIEKLRELQNAA